MAEDTVTSPSAKANPATTTPYQLDLEQTTKACKVLQQHIAQAREERQSASAKKDLLGNTNESGNEDDNAGLNDVPLWMILTGKKHIVDKVRLKPNKLRLPHPFNLKNDTTICLITADPQRLYKDCIADPAFPDTLRPRISRVIGVEKLKAKYKSFESKRQLAAEHDYFFADSRVWTYLPKILGKVFFQGGSKRPIPVDLGGPQVKDPSKAPILGEKRRSTKGTNGNGAAKPQVIAKEIEKALSSTLVHLTTSNTTAIKIGTAGMTPTETVTNAVAVIEGVTSRLLPQGWRNVRAVHIKGPNTPAFPIWLASELWANEEDVLEERKVHGKKRKRQAQGSGVHDETQSGNTLAKDPTTRSKGGTEKRAEKVRQTSGAQEALQRKQSMKKQKASILAEADSV